MLNTYQHSEQDKATLHKRLAEIRSKLERLEERFVMEEITGEMFQKFGAKLKAEACEAEAELQKKRRRRCRTLKIVWMSPCTMR
jgi:hypothetical protein